MVAIHNVGSSPGGREHLLASDLSKSQIDRLGDRLRKDEHLDSDLELLDAFRSSFGDAQAAVVQKLRELGLNPVGRIAKTTPSIVGKLKRGRLKLTRIQDIAGCRIIVENIAEQDRVVALLIAEFPTNRVVDRREKPSHGYRAVHIIVETGGKSVEIQVRTQLQHLWASFSEETADAIDHSIKYGGGPSGFHDRLQEMSDRVARAESESESDQSLERRLETAALLVEGVRLLIPDLDAQRFVREILGGSRRFYDLHD
jgi:putative GTP pyrophosphokinase